MEQLIARAVDDALFGGPTLHFIAIALGYFGADLRRVPRPDVRHYADPLRKSLPDAPWAALDRPATRGALAWLASVLPFNFR